MANTQPEQIGKSLTSMRLNDFLGGQETPIFSPDNDFAKCELCQEFTVKTFQFAGKVKANRICDTCRQDLQDQEEKRRIATRQADIENILARCGVPKRFLDCTLKNFQGATKLNLKDRPSFITGPAGTGKTHLAVAFLGQALIQHGDQHGRFLEAVGLFMRLRDTFSKNASLDESGVLTPFIDIPLLILDDLGAEKLSDYVKQSLYLLINRRYGDCRDTIITSNLSLEEIKMSYGDRLASRIAGLGKELVLSGRDRRIKS